MMTIQDATRPRRLAAAGLKALPPQTAKWLSAGTAESPAAVMEKDRDAVVKAAPKKRGRKTAAAVDHHAIAPLRRNVDGGADSITAADTAAATTGITGSYADIISMIVVEWRTRQRWHQAEKILTLQGKAYCRGAPGIDGDKAAANKLFDEIFEGGAGSPGMMILLSPFVDGIKNFRSHRKESEKNMVRMVKQLPIRTWASGIKNVGDMSIAAIIGEAGDISRFDTPSKFWKRMGLAVMDGRRQGSVAKDAVDPAGEFIVHGYSKARRSVMYLIGGSLIGGMGHGPRLAPGEDPETREDLSYYQRLFVTRCRYQAIRTPEFARPNTTDAKTGGAKESFSAHCSAQARRYVEKRFLLHFYRAWRDTMLVEGAAMGASPNPN